MRKILILLVLLVYSTPVFSAKQVQGVTYNANIIRVSDGDTVLIQAPFLPDPLKKELAVRIYGVDTPEKGAKAKCDSENQRGQMATKFTKDLILNAQNKQVVLYAWDKFGGRVLGDIILDGKSLRMSLIENNFAREYYGEAKLSWCN